MLDFLEGYYGIMIAQIKAELAYKLDLLMSLLFRAMTVLALILIWTAIYNNTGVIQIAGFTLPKVYAYFFLATSMFLFINSDIGQNLQDAVNGGTLTSSLVRPINFIGQLFFSSFSSQIISNLFVALPLLLIGCLLTAVQTDPVTLGFVFIEMLIGYLIWNVIDFLQGTLALFLTEIWGIMSITGNFAYLLSGAVLPLSFFPQWAQNILSFLPFQLMVYVPASTLLGTISENAIINSLIVGLVWLLGLTIFAYFWWRKIRKNVISVGG